MQFLNAFKISTKMSLLFALSALSLAALIALGGWLQYDRMFNDRIAKLRTVSEIAHGIASGLDAEVKAGKLTQEQAMERFRQAAHSMWYDNRKEYVIAFTMEGTTVANAANPQLVGQNRINNKDVNDKPIVGSMVELLKRQSEGTVTYYYPKAGEKEPLPKTTYVKAFTPWNMFVGTGVYTDDLDADIQAQVLKLAKIGAAVLVLCGLVFFLISRGMTRALGRLRGGMEKMAEGDFSVEIEGAARGDEVGDMARAVQVFKENGLKNRELQAEMEANRLREEEARRLQEARDREAEAEKHRLAEEARAAEDRRRSEAEAAERRKQAETEKLKADAEAERQREMLALADSFEQAVGGIVGTVAAASTKVRGLAEAMVGAVDRTNSQAASVATASEQTSANVQTVAAATEELSASLGEISCQVHNSTRIAGEAVSQANATNAQVESLTEAAKRIGEIVNLIQGIASQTNLLALNATIEAARAGEAGKGFAVVASEVKMLANQTAKATDDISTQIGAIQTNVGDAATSIRSIGRTIDQVNEIATVIASAVTQQGAATQEITTNVQQAATGTQEMSASIAGVSQIAAETREAADQVLGAAGDLSKQAEMLSAEVTRFVQRVRAA